MKLKRKHHRYYLRSNSTMPWFLVGKGLEEMSVEMNGSFEQKTDITGETTTSDKGYAPQTSVSPYYADPTDGTWYEFLKDLALNRKSGDDAKCELMEVLIEDESAASHSAWKENARIEIASYGGDTSGFQISYNVWSDGERTEGSAAYSNGVPTWSGDPLSPSTGD